MSRYTLTKLIPSCAVYFILLLQSAHSDPQLPCFFVFGDSLSDNGNNNNLPTLSRVNYPPYGIDYPGQQPTGRFSNGLNIVDFIDGHLGFEESMPPFALADSIEQQIILRGVNYASGSAGIRQETGQHLGVRIPLDQQLINHETILSRISNLLGNGSSSYLSRCLYMVNIGSNDYLNNYFMPESYSTSQEYTPDQYAQVLVQQYHQQIERLYGMGARKVALFALGELGFLPQVASKYGLLGNLCSQQQMNIASMLFNNRLRMLVDELNSELTDATFTCVNMDVLLPTVGIAFLNTISVSCCEVRSDGLCKEGTAPCANRNHYAFFDNFHPTEAMNRLIGARAYRAATPLDVYPFDIRTLVRT